MTSENTLNDLAKKVKMLEDRISELNDLQIINKLDIINLKNELEKLGLSGGRAPAPPPVPAGPLTCKKCGTALPEGVKFCKKCGEKVKK